jgi:ribosomal protein S27AE
MSERIEHGPNEPDDANLRCPQCGKLTTLTEHEEWVSQEIWFVCDLCGARTSSYEIGQANPGIIVGRE